MIREGQFDGIVFYLSCFFFLVHVRIGISSVKDDLIMCSF